MDEKTLVVGSIAFDHIFSIQPSFKQELPLIDGELKQINMTFVASSDTTVIHGGTGSNIAYSHALISDKVTLFSAVGNDYHNTMGKVLHQMGVEDKTVVFQRDTARSLQITDSNGEQMIVWQPNAYEHIGEIDLTASISPEELQSFTQAIFSPGSPVSTLRHMRNYREFNKDGIVYFDPGQMVNFYSKEQFESCCNLSDVIIANTVEFQKIKNAFGLDAKVILSNYKISKVIETMGAKGSEVYTKDGKTTIPAYPVVIGDEKEIEATGAGDAFRGALLGAVTRGFSFYDACKIGSVISASCVKHKGGQLHSINWEEAKTKSTQLT